MDLPISIRDCEQSDLPFVFSSWLRSYRLSSFARSIPNRDYYSNHHLVVDRLVQAPETKILVATDVEDPTVLLGFLVFEPGVIHFAYTKKPFRGLQVFRRLLEASGLDLNSAAYSHFTTEAASFIKTNHNLKYLPYAAFK